MFLCQWQLDIVFGKQRQALDIIKEWGAEKMRSSGFSKSTGGRVYTGYAGESAARIVDEYVFENLHDFEKALNDMGKPQFKKFSDAIASLVVPGTQKWKIFKIAVVAV